MSFNGPSSQNGGGGSSSTNVRVQSSGPSETDRLLPNRVSSPDAFLSPDDPAVRVARGRRRGRTRQRIGGGGGAQGGRMLHTFTPRTHVIAAHKKLRNRPVC